MCKAAKDKATYAETVAMSASSRQLIGVLEQVSDIRQQRDENILFDLGSQVLVTEEIHCKEKDIACTSFVSEPLTTLSCFGKQYMLTGLLAGKHVVMHERDNIQHARHYGHLKIVIKHQLSDVRELANISSMGVERTSNQTNLLYPMVNLLARI